MLNEAIAELLNKFGYGSIWTIIIVIVFKYGIKPIFEMIIENKKMKESKMLQAQLDRENNIQSNMQSSALEFDKYKRDIVLPVLQEIANILEKNHTCMQDYCTFITNDYLIEENRENLIAINKERETLLIELKRNVRKVSIYLPKELRILLLLFHISIEQHLFSIDNLKSLDKRDFSNEDIIDLNGNIMKIYLAYLECFYALVEKYIEITHLKKDYQLIFKEQGLNEKGEFLCENEEEIYCAIHILSFNRKSKELQREILQTIVDKYA